ncbi:MAG: hypothetical protein K8R16_09790 [Anaerolineales bacterium]|nr:hypothetical protein [Anaerolineales bacterium]
MNIVFTIIGSAAVFAIVFGFAAYTRYLQHKETMALAEKGLLPPEKTGGKEKTLKQWGMIFSGLGAVLVMVLIPFAWDNFWLLLLFGLLPLALGLGLILIYLFMQEGPQSDEKPAKEKNK